MSITADLTRVCKALKAMKTFNGLRVLGASSRDEAETRKDCESDCMTPAATEAYITEYGIAQFNLDTDWGFSSDRDNEYTETSFNYDKLETDFRAWLVEQGIDPLMIPKNLRLDGRDNEFMMPGWKFEPEFTWDE